MTENEIKEEIKELYRKAKVFEDSGYATEGISATFKKSAKIIHNLLTEIQQYRAIGTVDEFKALKEKNTPKKVAYQGEHEKCPNCGSFHVFGKHCTECGQAVDYD